MPKIICLCGSTRFTTEMLITQWNLTKQGHVVLSWCALPDAYYTGEDKSHIGDQEGVKEVVDEVHKRKIDLCDEVFVLNIGGYIGDSTTSEVIYAMEHGKVVRFLEPEWSYPMLEDKAETPQLEPTPTPEERLQEGLDGLPLPYWYNRESFVRRLMAWGAEGLREILLSEECHWTAEQGVYHLTEATADHIIARWGAK